MSQSDVAAIRTFLDAVGDEVRLADRAPHTRLPVGRGRGGEASEMSVRRDVFSLFDGADLGFEHGTETVEVSTRYATTRFAIGEPGGGLSLSIHDEFVELRTDAGHTAPAIIEQGILRRVC